MICIIDELDNQLFCYAAARCLTLKNNIEIVIDAAFQFYYKSLFTHILLACISDTLILTHGWIYPSGVFMCDGSVAVLVYYAKI